MFDMGFWEIGLILVVALLILGPERLPAFARTVAKYVSKIRRTWDNARRQIEREIEAEELRESWSELRKGADDLTAQAKAPTQAASAGNDTGTTSSSQESDASDSSERPATPEATPAGTTGTETPAGDEAGATGADHSAKDPSSHGSA